MEPAVSDLTNEVISEDKIKAAPELVILTGLSGAGRTEAMHVVEDLGYFCIDNLPAGLIGDVMALKG